MRGGERHNLTRLKALVEHVKGDWIPLLMTIPLLSQSLNRLLGKDPVFRNFGLSLAKRGVETHGGRIWDESEGLGRGCTFCFLLPMPHEHKAC